MGVVKVNPVITNEVGKEYQAVFSFPIPDLTIPPYQWNNNPIITDLDGTNGTLFSIVYPADPLFPGFDGTNGTNFVSEILENEGFIFSSNNPFENIKNWNNFKDTITGDTDFLNINKQFRVSYNNRTWSDWYDLSIDNLNLYASNVAYVYIEFKFLGIETDRSYTTNIIINKPYKIGWDKVSSGTNGFYIFDRDYPEQGTLIFKIGNVVLNSNSIKFGTNLPTATNKPKKGDFIFLNPLFQGLTLNGGETLEIIYTERVLAENHKKKIFLQKFELSAETFLVETNTLFSLNYIGERIILKPPFLIKAFSFTGYQISLSGVTTTRTIDIKYRYSFNQKKWSNWEPLTNENISTINPDKTRFFYIEFAFTRTGTDTTGSISLNDLIIEGDYQNVSADYEKINKFGLRSDCTYGKDCSCSNCGCNTTSTEQGTDECSDVKLPDEWSDPNCKGTFNPYEIYKNIGLYNKLANDVTNILGWEVDYYRTDVDGSGIDRFLHEQQLHNIADIKKIKVIPAENKFPESMLAMDGFNFALLENFEIHITKEEFKNAFGIAYRPAKKDRLWFCQANKLYEVEHSQSFKDFMNASVYYKVRLKPATNDQSIGNMDKTPLADLMKNNSIDSLFGINNQEETNKIADKDYMNNLTEDVVRLSVKAPITEYELQNGPNLVSRNYYSLITLTNRPAITYQKIDNKIIEGENRSFMCWFNLNNLTSGQEYNFIDNKNSVTGKGYTISYKDGNIIVEWNELYYELAVTLQSLKWYAILINFNQREHKLEWSVYKRFSDTTPGTASIIDLELVAEGSEDLVPQSWNDDIVLQLIGSPMYYTNMRIFKDVIQKDKHFRVLNQLKIKDTSQLLIADNADRKVITPHHRF